MTIEELRIPTERDLPPWQLAKRRDELVRQIARDLGRDSRHADRTTNRRLPSSLRNRRRSVVIAFAALVLCAGVVATPAFGIRDSVLRALHVMQPAPPGVAAPFDENDWRTTIFAAAHDYPQAQFDNPPEGVLRARLKRAAADYNFTLERVEILQPAGQAPFIVIRSDDPQQLVKATPAILRLIDPKAATSDDRTGWVYEAFFFEARDANNVPFLLTYNSWRGPHAGGGQWARSNDLFPFEHG